MPVVLVVDSSLPGFKIFMGDGRLRLSFPFSEHVSE